MIGDARLEYVLARIALRFIGDHSVKISDLAPFVESLKENPVETLKKMAVAKNGL